MLIAALASYLGIWIANGFVISRWRTKHLLQSNAANALPVWTRTVVLNQLILASFFVLWVLGVIPHINIAFALALLIFIAIYWQSHRQIKQAFKTTALLAELEIGQEKWP